MARRNPAAEAPWFGPSASSAPTPTYTSYSPAPIVSETIETGDHRRVDLGTFDCRDISRSTVLQRVCYDPAQQHLIVAASGTYDRYCGVSADTVERLLDAPSMGQFFNQNIKRDVTAGRYACPARDRVLRS